MSLRRQSVFDQVRGRCSNNNYNLAKLKSTAYLDSSILHYIAIVLQINADVSFRELSNYYIMEFVRNQTASERLSCRFQTQRTLLVPALSRPSFAAEEKNLIIRSLPAKRSPRDRTRGPKEETRRDAKSKKIPHSPISDTPILSRIQRLGYRTESPFRAAALELPNYADGLLIPFRSFFLVFPL
jgi:hypothetical protein